MARDQRDRRPATDRPAKGSKWVWIVGAIFLVIVIVLLIRGFVYGASESEHDAIISDQDLSAAPVSTDTRRV